MNRLEKISLEKIRVEKSRVGHTWVAAGGLGMISVTPLESAVV
jgi:hypothetical protein